MSVREQELAINRLINEASAEGDKATLVHLCHALNVHFASAARDVEHGIADLPGLGADTRFSHVMAYINTYVVPSIKIVDGKVA